MELKDKIYESRKAQGMTQEELALLCDVSRQAISKWENGTAKPDLENLRALSSALHISCDELLGVMLQQTQENQTSYQNIAQDDEREDNRVAQEDVIILRVRHHAAKEYTSKLRVFGLPLIQINLGRGKDSQGKRRVAKGVIAIGNTAVGLFTFGFMSFGLVSFGLLAVGLLACMGILGIGGYVLATLAIGYFSIGALAIGIHAIGALSIGYQTAFGALAYGPTAIGVHAFGDHIVLLRNNNSCVLNTDDYRWLQQFLHDTKLPALMRLLLETIPYCG